MTLEINYFYYLESLITEDRFMVRSQFEWNRIF